MKVVNGFTGSSIWHLLYSFPPVSDAMIDAGFKLLAERWNPILDVFKEDGVKFGLEVHPTEIAFDIYSAEMALKALDHRPEFGFNFDPSHLLWQMVDPVEFIRAFPDRIYHVHVKDAARTLDGKTGILGSHLNFGDPRRGWDFRSPGRGQVDFEEIARALNADRLRRPALGRVGRPRHGPRVRRRRGRPLRQGEDGLRRRRPPLRLGLRRGPGQEVTGVTATRGQASGGRQPPDPQTSARIVDRSGLTTVRQFTPTMAGGAPTIHRESRRSPPGWRHSRHEEWCRWISMKTTIAR